MYEDHLSTLIRLAKRLQLNIPREGERINGYSTHPKPLHARKKPVPSPRTSLMNKPCQGRLLKTWSPQFGEKINLLQQKLEELRREDQALAKQFLQIYRDIQILKVRRSCREHQDLLDETIFDAEEDEELPNLCDIPLDKFKSHKLAQCGLTKMNIKSRKYSCS